MTMVTFRPGTEADAPAVNRLIADNLESGHLLPRTIDEIVAHAPRFIVAEHDGAVIACAELAPLSNTVAEVRSLVVDEQRPRQPYRPAARDRARLGGRAHVDSRRCAHSPTSRRIS